MYKPKYKIGDRLWCFVKIYGLTNLFNVIVSRIIYINGIDEPPMYYCQGIYGNRIEDEETLLNENDLFLTQEEAKESAKSC